MKQCFRCGRAYSDELTYCLDDGTRLVKKDEDEETQVYPQPAPPGPTPIKHTGLKVLGVLLAMAVVALLGVLVVALWWLGKHENNDSAQNTNSASRSLNANPSSTPSLNPSPSPSTMVAEASERSISTGTYQCEVTRALKGGDKEGTGTLKYQFTFNSDGTFLMQGYITVYGTAVNDLLGIEEKGTYSQSNKLLLLEDRLDREYDLETNSWKSWTTPSEGSESREQIRHVTPTTFQMYDDKEKAWFTFAKL